MASPQILAKKEKEVEALGKIFNTSGVYLFDFRGLKVSEFQELRQRIRQAGGNVKVIKNRLAVKYFEKEKRECQRDSFRDPVAVAYSNDRIVETAKTLVEFEKEIKKIKIKSGIIEQRWISEKQITEVAKLPNRERLLAQFLMSLALPLQKFAFAFSAPLTHLLLAMKKLKDKKEKGG